MEELDGDAVRISFNGKYAARGNYYKKQSFKIA